MGYVVLLWHSLSLYIIILYFSSSDLFNFYIYIIFTAQRMSSEQRVLFGTFFCLFISYCLYMHIDLLAGVRKMPTKCVITRIKMKG